MRNTDSWRWYLAVGGLSVLKALALRNDRRRFRRELVEAGMFVGLGLLTYRLQSGGGSGTGGSPLRALTDGERGRGIGSEVLQYVESTGTGDSEAARRLARAVDRAEPVVREAVVPMVRRRLRSEEEAEPDRLERLRRRFPA